MLKLLIKHTENNDTFTYTKYNEEKNYLHNDLPKIIKITLPYLTQKLKGIIKKNI